MKHTTGKWKVTHQTATDYSFDIVVDGKCVATCGATKDVTSEIAANAKLIAAAPELLEALKKIGNMMHPNQSQLIINMRNIAGQAIAKAEV